MNASSNCGQCRRVADTLSEMQAWKCCCTLDALTHIHTRSVATAPACFKRPHRERQGVEFHEDLLCSTYYSEGKSQTLNYPPVQQSQPLKKSSVLFCRWHDQLLPKVWSPGQQRYTEAQKKCRISGPIQIDQLLHFNRISM